MGVEGTILYRKPCPSEFRMHQFIVFQLLLVGLKIRVHPDSLFFANDLFFFSLWKAVYIHSSGSLNVASLNVKTHVHTFWNVFLNSLLLLSPFYLSSFVELFIHILNLFLNCFFISLRVSLFFSLSTILSQKLP